MIPLLDGRVKTIHVEMDDFSAPAGHGDEIRKLGNQALSAFRHFDAQALANTPCQVPLDFRMSRNRFARAVGGIGINRMTCAFTQQTAPVRFKMPQ
jgi:hypothetical protein